MKSLVATILPLSLLGCASAPYQNQTTQPVSPSVCQGNPLLPERLSNAFERIDDPVLLAQAIGEPNQGKLCQGQVYISKPFSNVRLYRAWNSTNPNSMLGKWWAYEKPSGSISRYREDYEICYQWSPLDKLIQCELKPGVKIVVGTGQSATCSKYLTYPTSQTQQVYIDDASNTVINCVAYDAEFSWKLSQVLRK